MTAPTIHSLLDPADGVPSASRYSQAVEVAPGLRWLATSGQIGYRPDGSLPADEAGQHAEAWANVIRLLAAAGMGVEHIVRVNAFVTAPAEVPRFREARDRALGAARPASTLVIVAALVVPELVVEIEVTAAAPCTP